MSNFFHLRSGFIQKHGWDALNPPDPTPAHEATYTLSSAPKQDNIIPQTAAELSQLNSQAFANSHTLSNAAFFPITSFPGESPQQTRTRGLTAYVTQDLDPSASLTSTQIFGNTPVYLNDHTTNMAVGRALASAAGYTGDPALFLRERGASSGFTFPSSFANDNQLYAHIGEQFSQRERAKAQKTNTQIQERRPSQKEIDQYLPSALLKSVSDKKLNWVEASIIKRAGIPESSIRKVRHLIQDGKIPGFNSGWRKALNSRFNDLEIADMATYVKDDPIARFILLELARKQGYQSRSDAHSDDGIKMLGKAQIEAFHNLKEPFIRDLKESGSPIATTINSLLDGNFSPTFTDEADERNTRAFKHDFINAFNLGYNQRDEEIKNNLKDSFSFDVSNLLMKAGAIAGETLPYFSLPTAAVALGGMASEEMNKAASNALADDALYTASDWELYGTPFAKTSLFGGSIAFTGGLAKGGISLVSRTALGAAAAQRLAATPLSRYASRVAEGTATEAAEELTNALAQESLELTGLVADRQKEDHFDQFYDTMASADFWGADIAMNLGLSAFGLKGSRSKAPYTVFAGLNLDDVSLAISRNKDAAEALSHLQKLGFSRKEALDIAKQIHASIQAGGSIQDANSIVTDNIRLKQAENPAKVQEALRELSRDLAAKQAIEEAAASGVRDYLLKEANISDMQKLPNGKIKATFITRDPEGQFDSIEHEVTEQELNDMLLQNLDSAITQEIINTQQLVRGEKLTQAAQSLQQKNKAPFARIATLADAPAELLAQLKGKDTFDKETLSLFASYALNNLQTPDFGTTGAPTQAVASLAANFQNRVDIARAKGEIAPDAPAASTAFIITGKTPGDNILMLARGQVTPKSIAHDWLEGFARSRYDKDPIYWRNVLDAVDRELTQNKVTSQSLFAKPEGQRQDLDYIEAFSDLATQNWLAHHDSYNINETAHALADEMLADLGSVQSGLALAQELKNYLNSDTAKEALGQDLDPLRQILTDAGANLTDLIQEAQNVSPKNAADFVLQRRQRIQQEIDSLAQEAEIIDSAPPVTSLPPDTQLQNAPTDLTTPSGEPVTHKDIAQHNGIDPTLGTLIAPPTTSYATVTAPDGAGKSLNGGIAHRNRDRSIEGAAPLASLTLHQSLSHTDISRAQGDTNAPVICYRTKGGLLHVIGGFARLAHDQKLGLTNTHVKVFPAGSHFSAAWAADRATQESIRAGIATTQDTIKYLTKHKLSRNQARRQRLIPSDPSGQELPTSRAAWLLLKHAPPKTVALFSMGKISLKEALSSISSQDSTKSYSDEAKELVPLFDDNGASFSLQTKKAKRRYTKLADMVKHEQFLALLDEAKRIERQSLNFIDPEKDLDATLIQSAKLNGLLNAIYSLIPKDARPWKTLPRLESRFHAFAQMAVNPHLPFDPNSRHAKNLTPAEIERYNDLTPAQRRDFIASKLAYAYKELAKATARSLEAYLSRSLFEQVERAIKSLQPKLQTSGKEKRGITSDETFTKAMSFYNMMIMTPEAVSIRQRELSGLLENSHNTEQQIDAYQREINALSLFGALRSADLKQTQDAINVFMDFVELGKETWEYKLSEERQAAEKIRTALAKIRPTVRTSAVNKENQETKTGLSNTASGMLDSFMNLAQTIHALSAIPGDFGKYMENTLGKLSVAQDLATQDINAYMQKADDLLDAVLDIQNLPPLIRDAKRAAFHVQANQYKHPHIFRKGTIRIHNYKFSKAQIDYLQQLKKDKTKKELIQEIEKHRISSNTDQDARVGTLPSLRALKDAIAQTKDEKYQGGDVYVQIYLDRDTDHTEQLDITPLQAANLVLMAEQPSYADKYEDLGEDENGNDRGSRLVEPGTMTINGYSEDVLFQLEQYAGAPLLNWLRQLRELFNTTGLFEAYQEYVGLPFPKEENYWPGIFETPKQGSMTDALDSAAQGMGLNQMLIKRRDHISPPDISIPATAAWQSAITQHFTYIHLSPITRELRRIFRNTDFRTRLADISSKQIVDNFVQLLDTIDGAPSLCLKALKPLNRTYAQIVGKHAANTLSGATASGLKNLTGILNGTAYQGINTFNLIPYILKGASGHGHITPIQLAKLPVFKNRLNRDTLTSDAKRLQPGQKQTILNIAKILGMRYFMEYPDLASNLLSMTAVYNHQYDTLLRSLKQEYGKNYTPTPQDLQTIKTACEQTVSRTMHMAAQPMEQNDKAAFVQTQNWAQNMTTYMKGEILVKIGLARAQYLHRRLQHPNATGAEKTLSRLHAVWDYYSTIAKYSLAGQTAAVLLTIAANGEPDDEDEFQNWLLSNTIAGLIGFGLVSLIPLIGDTISAIGQYIFGQRGAFATYSTTGIGGIHMRNIKNAVNLLDPEQEMTTGERWLAISDASRFAGTLIGSLAGSSKIATIAGELLTGLSTILNTARPYFQNLKNTQQKDTKADREHQRYLKKQRALLRQLQKINKNRLP